MYAQLGVREASKNHPLPIIRLLFLLSWDRVNVVFDRAVTIP
jgi:hypothetical protein